jgi:hypothetical protein
LRKYIKIVLLCCGVWVENEDVETENRKGTTGAALI